MGALVNYHRRRVQWLLLDRQEYLRRARLETGHDRKLFVRLAHIVNGEIVASKRKINILQGRVFTDDGVRYQPRSPQLELEG